MQASSQPFVQPLAQLCGQLPMPSHTSQRFFGIFCGSLTEFPHLAFLVMAHTLSTISLLTPRSTQTWIHPLQGWHRMQHVVEKESSSEASKPTLWPAKCGVSDLSLSLHQEIPKLSSPAPRNESRRFKNPGRRLPVEPRIVSCATDRMPSI